MRTLNFDALADYLKHGREIEFAYNRRRYSITNHSGFWYLCDDTDHILLDTLCRFDEKDLLVSRIAMFTINGISIKEIFDRKLYAEDWLDIL